MNKAGKSASMQIYSTLSSNGKTRIFQREARIFQRKDAKTQRERDLFLNAKGTKTQRF